ncbi:uncharacterized protein Hen1 [Prorops nasuta]|uniref:uncharacterized protein Hen1 n=1 Tax=Prorops nasuta TaxID=863751 RepID=UPI0034CE5B49
MIFVLFHVLYLLGKIAYKNYISIKTVSDKNVSSTVENEIKEESCKPSGFCDTKELKSNDEEERSDLRFYPPAYIQRYKAVGKIFENPKYKKKLRKVVDFGCAELKLFTYLKNVYGIEEALFVDTDRYLLEQHASRVQPLASDYVHPRESPLIVKVYEGSVTESDSCLENTDIVICIELIEHLYENELKAFVPNVFGFIKPKVVVITTPNRDFNVLFKNMHGFRHYDHKFEWSRKEFQNWADDVIQKYPEYEVSFDGICKGPEGTEHLGHVSQMAIFDLKVEKCYQAKGVDGLYKLIREETFPYEIDSRSDEEKILHESKYFINILSFRHEEYEKLMPIEVILNMLGKYAITKNELRSILEQGNVTVLERDDSLLIKVPPPLPPEFGYVEIDAFADRWHNQNSGSNEDVSEDESGNGNEDWDANEVPVDGSENWGENDDWNSSMDEWQSENSDDEQDILIPQDSSFHHSNSYLLDDVDGNDSISSTHMNPLMPVSGIESHDLNSDIYPDNWDKEESIIIPQNNTIDKNNTYLFDAENVSLSRTQNFSASENSIRFDQSEIGTDLFSSSRIADERNDTNLLDHSNFSNSVFKNTSNQGLLYLSKQEIETQSSANSSVTPNENRGKLRKTERLSVTEDGFGLKPEHPQYTSSPKLCTKNQEKSFDGRASKRISLELNVNSQDSDQIQAGADLESSYLNDIFSGCQEEEMQLNKPELYSINDVATDISAFHQLNTTFIDDDTSTHESKVQSATISSSTDNLFSSSLNVHIGSVLSNQSVNSNESECQSKSYLAEQIRTSKSFRIPNTKSVTSPISETADGMESRVVFAENVETPPNSRSPDVIDSGYPKSGSVDSASIQDITQEYDSSSISEDQIPDSKSPSVAEIPRLGIVDIEEVENGDLANNNRDDEDGNMVLLRINVNDLEPLINELENDIENENDIYAVQNGFPIWLLRILEHHRDREQQRLPDFGAEDAVRNDDEGFNDVVANEEPNHNEMI